MPTTEQKLLALAQLDSDYSAFTASLPVGLAGADAQLPDGLAEDVLALLQAERPELSDLLNAQLPASPPSKAAVDPLALSAVLGAILFLLQSHIKIEGENFIFEHPPIDNDLLKRILDNIMAFLGIKPKSDE